MLFFGLLFGIAACCSIVGSASPSPIWPTTCQNVATSFPIPSSGGQHEAIGCTFAAFINITAPQSMQTTAEVVLSGGEVSAGNNRGIGIAGPLAANAVTMGPIAITVSNIYFGQNAVIRFTGALPPSSHVVIANNTFLLTTTNTNSGAYSGSILGGADIVIGDFQLPTLQLSSGASIIVTNNTCSARFSGWSPVSVVFIPLSTLMLASGSSFSLRDK